MLCWITKPISYLFPGPVWRIRAGDSSPPPRGRRYSGIDLISYWYLTFCTVPVNKFFFTKHSFLNIFPVLRSCGSGMFFPDPGSWFLPIADPKKVPSHFCCHIFPKIKIIFFLAGEKLCAHFQRIIDLFYPIKCLLVKIWVWDPEKSYSGSRIQG